MSFLGKALIAATSRKNAPPRLDDVETYRFGEYDVDLSDILVSEVEETNGVYKKYSMYRNGIRPITVNYSSDGLNYYITRQHTGLGGTTTNTNYYKIEVMHLTLSSAHNLKTITSSVNHIVDFYSAHTQAAMALSRNQYSKFSWHNGGYNFTYIGRSVGSQTELSHTAYAFSVTTPYTGIGATLIDEIHDPLFDFDSEIVFNADGSRGIVLTRFDRPYSFHNALSANHWKLGNGDRGSSTALPNRCSYWNKLTHMSSINSDATPGRIFAHKVSSSEAYVFYPHKTSSNVLNYNSFFLNRHTTGIRSNEIDYMQQDVTTNEYNIGQIIYDNTSPTIALRGQRDYTWSSDGLKFYVIARPDYSSNNPYYVYGFNCSTAFDPSTITGTYQVIPSAGLTEEQWISICAMCFNNRPTYPSSSDTTADAAGTVLYVLQLNSPLSSRRVHVFDLSTAWDVSTATYRDSRASFDNFSISTVGNVNKARYTSVMMHHPTLNHTSTTKGKESVIVYPYFSNTTGQQTCIINEKNNQSSLVTTPTDLKEQLDDASKSNGGGYSLTWNQVELNNGETSNGAHQMGEEEYDTTGTRVQIRREAYYRKLHKASITYSSSAATLTAEVVFTGADVFQTGVETIRGGQTGPTRTNWIDSYGVGKLHKYAPYTYTAGSNKYATIWMLFNEVADNKDLTNDGTVCLNRYRLGGVSNWDINTGNIGSSSFNSRIDAAPITEIFSSSYSDGPERISAMFPVPKVGSGANEVPARMGFIDDRGYLFYLDTEVTLALADGKSWPLPSSINHPGRVTTGTKMGNAMKYTTTENTISCHKIYQDDLTIYDTYQKYQTISDFDFDPTGHVCCVLGIAASGAGSDTRTIFVYYVDKPFSTNKDDWTYVTSGSTTNIINPYQIRIFDNNVVIFDYDNDFIVVTVDIAGILANGPAHATTITFNFANSQSGSSDWYWIDNNVDSVGTNRKYYKTLRTDVFGGQIYIYNGSGYLDTSGNTFEGFSSDGNAYWLDNGIITRPTTDTFSERAIWYDETHETFYFVGQHNSQNSDNVLRAPLKLYKSRVINKAYSNNDWLIEEPQLFELKTQVPFLPDSIKIYRDRLYFVEWQGRFLGSTRMR